MKLQLFEKHAYFLRHTVLLSSSYSH